MSIGVIMKKVIFSLSALPGVLLAEGTASSAVAYSGSMAETIATNAGTTLTNFLTGVGPTIAGIVVAGLAVWGGLALVGIVKKAFAVGKGR